MSDIYWYFFWRFIVLKLTCEEGHMPRAFWKLSAMKKHYIILILTGVLLLTSCGQNKHVETEKETGNTYRFLAYYDWFLGQDEYVDFWESESGPVYELNPQYGNSIDYDGKYLLITADESQRQALLKQNENLLEEAVSVLETSDDRFLVSYDTNYEKVTLTIDNMQNEMVTQLFAANNLELMRQYLGVVSIALANRILLTGDCNSILVTEIINGDSGYIAATALFPFQSLTLTDEDWLKSQNEDVLLSAEYAGYDWMDFTIEEADDIHLILKPADEEREFYFDDERLEICLDSVYAEDLFLPYGLKAQDKVSFLVDGLYAIHDDGNNIPDIAPMALMLSE